MNLKEARVTISRLAYEAGRLEGRLEVVEATNKELENLIGRGAEGRKIAHLLQRRSELGAEGRACVDLVVFEELAKQELRQVGLARSLCANDYAKYDRFDDDGHIIATELDFVKHSSECGTRHPAPGVYKLNV